MEKPVSVKIVLVGDGCVGKTCMLCSYVQDQFPQKYVPTIFDNHATALKVDNHMCNISLWDTAGQQEYARLRTLAYSNCDVFIIVCDITNPDSLTNVCLKWLPELENRGGIRIVVGNKKDCPRMYHQEQARKRVAQLGVQYLECSAKTQEGLRQAFARGIKLLLEKKFVPPSKTTCHLI